MEWCYYHPWNGIKMYQIWYSSGSNMQVILKVLSIKAQLLQCNRYSVYNICIYIYIYTHMFAFVGVYILPSPTCTFYQTNFHLNCFSSMRLDVTFRFFIATVFLWRRSPKIAQRRLRLLHLAWLSWSLVGVSTRRCLARILRTKTPRNWW